PASRSTRRPWPICSRRPSRTGAPVPTQEKVTEVQDLKSRFDGVKTVVLTEYRGLTVQQLSDLRKQLRAVSAQYKVVKNRLARLAIASSPLDGLGTHLKGPTGIITSKEDPVAVAKALHAFARAHQALAIKAGFVRGTGAAPHGAESAGGPAVRGGAARTDRGRDPGRARRAGRRSRGAPARARLHPEAAWRISGRGRGAGNEQLGSNEQARTERQGTGERLGCSGLAPCGRIERSAGKGGGGGGGGGGGAGPGA